jgi:hypothetical protein
MISFTPWPLFPRERAPGTHLLRGWVGLRASLNGMEERKIASPSRESNPGYPALNLVTVLALPSPNVVVGKMKVDIHSDEGQNSRHHIPEETSLW